MSKNNPSLQCSVCGQWKRLHGKDKSGKVIQRFYSCCGENGEFMHDKNVCDDCCKQKCPYKPNRIVGVQVSDTTGSDSSTTDDKQKTQIKFKG